MKRTIYLIIISVITTICMLIGLVINVIVPIGGTVFNEVLNISDTDEVAGNAANQTDAFEKINIDSQVINVTIQTGDTYGYTLSGHSGLRLGSTVKTNVTVVDKTLKVTQTGGSGISFGGSSCKLIVTVPADCVLSDVNIKSDVGNVKLTEVAVTNGTISADVGSVVITE